MAEAKPGEVSVYGRGSISPSVNAREMKKLTHAFPRLSAEWFSILSMRLKADGFTEERLTDAVDDLIGTCEYPEPTIARILGFDRKVTLLGYDAMCEKWQQGLGKFYKMVRNADDTHQPLWASMDDIERYHLPFVERRNEMPEVPPDKEGVPACPETVKKVRKEMDALTMAERTRLSKAEFEAKRRRAQEALKGEK